MHALIAVIAGDGIGAEVTAEAVRALERLAQRFGHAFQFEPALLGGAAIDATGEALPAATLALCRARRCRAARRRRRPEVVAIPMPRCAPSRGCCSCARRSGCSPICARWCRTRRCSTPRPSRRDLLHGVDIMVVRELTGGIYFGDKQRTATEAYDVCRYSVAEIERVVRLAAQLARARRRKLTSVDKANVLETSRLWRAVVERMLPANFRT